jgi:hypothetical protein
VLQDAAAEEIDGNVMLYRCHVFVSVTEAGKQSFG